MICIDTFLSFADDLPPPPPEPADYGPCNISTFPPPPDDLPPPPSPVSSSYSELRRATQFQSPNYPQDYSNYGPLSRVCFHQSQILNFLSIFIHRFVVFRAHPRTSLFMNLLILVHPVNYLQDPTILSMKVPARLLSDDLRVNRTKQKLIHSLTY